MIKPGQKIFFIFHFSFFIFHFSFSQVNLVPNPSFETYTTCPTTLGDYQASSWWVSSQTPDYFNLCANTYTNGCSGVPYNGDGYQPAFDGNAYCGVYTGDYYVVPNYREYISAKLTTTLTVGTKYYFSMQIASGIIYDTSFSLPCTQGNNGGTNKMGTLFTTNKYDASHVLNPQNFAHIYEPSIITDTANWTQVKGSFIADSAYQYINLGNFFDDNNTDTLRVIYGAAWYNGNYVCISYYYVDDVILSTDSTLIGIKQKSNKEDLVIFPNPILDNFFYIKSVLSLQTINVFNQLGEQVKFKLYNEPNNLVRLVFDTEIEKGIYYLEIISQHQTSHYPIIKN